MAPAAVLGNAAGEDGAQLAEEVSVDEALQQWLGCDECPRWHKVGKSVFELWRNEYFICSDINSKCQSKRLRRRASAASATAGPHSSSGSDGTSKRRSKGHRCNVSSASTTASPTSPNGAADASDEAESDVGASEGSSREPKRRRTTSLVEVEEAPTESTEAAADAPCRRASATSTGH